jgi:hypothetical protein
VTSTFARPGRRPSARLVAGLTLLATASLSACTGGSSTAPEASPSPSASTAAGATVEPRPVPLVVRVTRVHGHLAKKQLPPLEKNVGRTISRYLDAAYLGGDQPRRNFSTAYAAFTGGVRGQARRDADLTTNRLLGPSATAVVPKRTAAYLSVLAPYDVAAGVTANTVVTYVVERGDAPAREVSVTGKLSLTRVGDGWKIFRYDLARSVRTVGE